MQEDESDRDSNSMGQVCFTNTYFCLKTESWLSCVTIRKTFLSYTIAATGEKMVKKQFEESSEAEKALARVTKSRPSLRQLRSSQASLDIRIIYYLEDRKSVSTEYKYIF